jgi:nucleotide-binding universal stress UspA family protein
MTTALANLLVRGAGARRLTELGVTAEGVVREGSAGKKNVQEARKWEADLIVFGAHGLSGLESILTETLCPSPINTA